MLSDGSLKIHRRCGKKNEFGVKSLYDKGTDFKNSF